MKLEPFPQDVFPENFVQRAKVDGTIENHAMVKACMEEWTRQPMILLFDPDAVTNKGGKPLSNDLTQVIPHTHAWGGFLHFKGNGKADPRGSTIPTVFCGDDALVTALQAGCEKVAPDIQGLDQTMHVVLKSQERTTEWTAVPSVHIEEALKDLEQKGDAAFYLACGRIRQTLSRLPLEWTEYAKVMTAFANASQGAILDQSLPIDVSDGKTIAFPPKIGHFRRFEKKSNRPDNENPFGGKIH